MKNQGVSDTESKSLPELVSRSEAAAMLGVHDDTIYRWSRKGWLNPIKLPSGIHRYRRSELLAIQQGSGIKQGRT